ncbi:MAG: PfkB family carbohydrate kinase [Spirochaetota bacterium]
MKQNLSPGREVIVAGGLNEDIKARPFSAFTARTSNPGRIYRAPGGVGRNIAHCLALLGSRSVLCSAAGNDSAGRAAIESTAAAGVDTSAVITYPQYQTGAYLAIQDEHGDLSAAVSSMEIMEALTPGQLASIETRIIAAAALILDTNLSSAALGYLAELAHRHRVPCIVEPVSVEKARRLAPVLDYCSWISPNIDELSALFSINKTLIIDAIRCAASTPGRVCTIGTDMGAALDARSPAGPNPNILVTLGSRGLLLLSRNPQCPRQRTLSSAAQKEPLPSTPGRWRAWWYPPLDTEVADANGAGDAFLAGFTAAFTAQPAGERTGGLTVADAIAWGQAAAAITLESQHTVAAELSRSAVRRRLAE